MNQPIYYIDSHTHLTNEMLLPEAEKLLERAWEAGVRSIVNICTDVASLQAGLEISKRHPWVYNTASTTPHDAEKFGEAHFEIMATTARSGQLVAIGETGLDYFHYAETAETQKKLFRKYLRLAIECKKPVVIHCRDAFLDFFEILDEEYKNGDKWHPGVLHCFTGTAEEAQEVVKRGWYVSFSGIVTFKKSEDLRQIAKSVPLDQLLIETDAPYLAPQKYRGKTNEPAFLPNTAEVIAAVKGISVADAAAATALNAQTLFSLSGEPT